MYKIKYHGIKSGVMFECKYNLYSTFLLLLELLLINRDLFKVDYIKKEK
jgi:hypothetical protein